VPSVSSRRRPRAPTPSWACWTVIAGKYHEQFVVDVIQGGAGTSTNMNANEVIANRALEILGHERASYVPAPQRPRQRLAEHQRRVSHGAEAGRCGRASTACWSAMAYLRRAFERKAEEFADVLKMGRTQLQDAVPMTLGQEFSTYAVMLGEDEERLREAVLLIREINLGATAIGTGINAPPATPSLACRYLAEDQPAFRWSTAPNLIEATQDCGAFVQLSGVLKRVATKLQDLQRPAPAVLSGRSAGFGDINLPPRQAGSSIMPGKVNPVIPEVVNQVAFEVIGNDITVTMAAEAGQLQLNAFEPIIGHSLFKSCASPSRW
jgi:aspartate ammonia-lyase